MALPSGSYSKDILTQNQAPVNKATYFYISVSVIPSLCHLGSIYNQNHVNLKSKVTVLSWTKVECSFQVVGQSLPQIEERVICNSGAM